MTRSRHSQLRKKGLALVITALMLVFVIPIVGLAIDAGVLYVVRGKLSAAADAAAMAAARSLSVGLTLSEQASTAQARGTAFFNANFPNGVMDTTGRSVTVDVAETSARTRTVTVTSEASAPVYFMRTLGFSNTPVRVTGRASRRDVNVMLVIDRSGSMNSNGGCAGVRNASTAFVNMFANSRDRLGLITYGGAYRLDYAPNMNFKTSSPSLPSVISGITCSGWTGSAQALWNGYQQLANLNEPGALNVIIFFTDGRPNVISGEFRVKARTTTQSPTGTSRCYDFANNKNYTQSGWFPDLQVYRGYIAGDSAGSSRDGIYQNGAPAIPVSNDRVMVTKPVGFESSSISPSSSNDCFYRSTASNVHQDIAFYPDTDLYGNSIFGWKSITTYTSGPYTGKARLNSISTMENAAINAVDNAAARARNQVLNADILTTIYSIGLGDVDADQHTLLRRIANDATSPIFDSTKPQGMYIFAPAAADLNQAFVRIASEILRFAL